MLRPGVLLYLSADLFAGFDLVAARDIPVRTMNGRPALATQWLMSRS